MNKNIEAKAQMLIRRPVSDVFEAFVNPEITTKFWFTKNDGGLEDREASTIGMGSVPSFVEGGREGY